MIKDWPTQTDSTFNESTGGKLTAVPGHTPDHQATLAGNESSQPSNFQMSTPFVSLNSVTARLSDQLAQRRIQEKPSLPQSDGQLPQDEQFPEQADDCGQSEITHQDLNQNLAALVKDEMKKANEQRFKIKSKIDQLPTVGQLLTLDVKSNDLRSADVFYLAQVLKKNRTLKVLNLAENRIDPAGLVHLADALRYNTCLETLDLSRNSCCGPNLEGVLALRTTCTINSSLKRIFLSQTELSSQGSIAIAEFLPEMKNLIHLDLTENHGIDIAGVMALAVSAKMNTSIRCLDINIPPNDPDFAHLSQEILQSCVRNTELAQEMANQRGAQTTIAQPMLKSTVVKALANQQQQQHLTEPARAQQHSSSLASGRKPKNFAGIGPVETVEKILSSTEETCKVLRDLISEDEQRKIRMLQEERRVPMIMECSELVRELLDQVKAGQFQIKEALGNFVMDETLRSYAQSVHAQSVSVCEYAEAVHKEPGNTPSVSSSPSSLFPSSESKASPPDSKVTCHPESQNLELESTESSAAEGQGLHSPESASSDRKPDLSSSPPYASAHIGKERALQRIQVTIDTNSDARQRLESPSVIGGLPRSPAESHSRSLTIEEGEVFRKGSVLGTVTRDDDEEVPGEVLKETILVAQVERTRRNSNNTEDRANTALLLEEQGPDMREPHEDSGSDDDDDDDDDDGDQNEAEDKDLPGNPMREILD